MPNLLSIEALEADRVFAQRQLESLPASPWGTARLMWEQRLAEISRQIEEMRVSAATSASVALIFDGLPVVGQGDIRLDFSTDVLAIYQKIIAASMATLSDQQIATKGKIKGAGRSKLYIRDIVRGSMGFILEELSPPQTDMFNTPLKNAVERATEFLASLNTASDEDFNSAIDTAAPRLVSAVQKFAKVLKDAGATAKIVGSEHKLALGLEDVNRLSDRFTEVDVQEESVTLDGVLLGVLPDSHDFELEVDGQDGVLKGSATDDLVAKYVADQAFKEQLLLKPVTAFLRYTRTFRNSKLLREQVMLENLEPRIENEMFGRF
ncbi:hypothetical protein ASD01_29665 [Ensifer sp. Root423]|uniref:hypothetical protein n=1 Tax=Ensifer sp. Root423 TaxID=1736534 RepID=UPI0007126729|nr:hypothetical protein [Ensifer sp. Root423]KQX20984.1 hypothetical protein ASD01_29665 [Ensifer sp. Root423]